MLWVGRTSDPPDVMERGTSVESRTNLPILYAAQRRHRPGLGAVGKIGTNGQAFRRDLTHAYRPPVALPQSTGTHSHPNTTA